MKPFKYCHIDNNVSEVYIDMKAWDVFPVIMILCECDLEWLYNFIIWPMSYQRATLSDLQYM